MISRGAGELLLNVAGSIKFESAGGSAVRIFPDGEENVAFAVLLSTVLRRLGVAAPTASAKIVFSGIVRLRLHIQDNSRTRDTDFVILAEPNKGEADEQDALHATTFIVSALLSQGVAFRQDFRNTPLGDQVDSIIIPLGGNGVKVTPRFAAFQLPPFSQN